jgi:coenzyme F420 hydrogenase subunit delta
MDIPVDSYLPDFCLSQVLILGCGNILFGDDGFGPAVIKHLTENYDLPSNLCALDVGTGIRDLLCTIALSPVRPRKLVIVDTADVGHDPGQMLVSPIEDVAIAKAGSLSLHESPTTNLLKELNECCQVDVLLVSVQPKTIPKTVRPGLSPQLRRAVAPVCDYRARSCFYKKVGMTNAHR